MNAKQEKLADLALPLERDGFLRDLLRHLLGTLQEVVGLEEVSGFISVVGRPSLCMMTSNVFGTVSAQNLGYAKVCLEKTVAEGENGCRVVVHLADNEEAAAQEGNEYFRG